MVNMLHVGSDNEIILWLNLPYLSQCFSHSFSSNPEVLDANKRKLFKMSGVICDRVVSY